MAKKIIAAVLVLAILGGAVGFFLYRGSHITIDGKTYSRNITVLDLSGRQLTEVEALSAFTQLQRLDLRGTGISAAQYQFLRGALPGCTILWDIPFQGNYYDPDIQTLTITQLAESDFALLDQFPKLTTIDASACTDYAMLAKLQAYKPDCTVVYQIPLGGGLWDADVTEITVTQLNTGELDAMLPYLPGLTTIDLRSTGISHEDAMALKRSHPELNFIWEFQIGEFTVCTDQEEIDLSGMVMADPSPIEDMLFCFHNLKKVIMCDCGISNPDMDALNNRHEDVRFVWRLQLGPMSVRTDDTWFAPVTQGTRVLGHDIDDLKYCIDMECIDIGHSWVMDCEWARNMPNLKYLVIAETSITDISPLAGHTNLKFLEIFISPISDYSPLLTCTGLEDLNLGYTEGDPTPIAQMTWLKNLWWGSNVPIYDPQGRTREQVLEGALPNTKVMLYNGSSTGYGWRELQNYYDMRDMIGMYYMPG